MTKSSFYLAYRQLLARACGFRSGARELVFQQGLLQWVQYQLSSQMHGEGGEERRQATYQLLDIVRAAFESLVANKKDSRKSVEHKMEVDESDNSSSEDEEHDDESDEDGESEADDGKDAQHPVLPTWIECQFKSALECFIRTVEKPRFADENGAVLDRVLKLKATINTLCSGL